MQRDHEADGGLGRPSVGKVKGSGDPSTTEDSGAGRPAVGGVVGSGDPATTTPGDPATTTPGDPATTTPGDPATTGSGDPSATDAAKTAEHRDRDATSMLLIGPFLILLAVLVLIGSFWSPEWSLGLVVNIVVGLVLLVLGAGMLMLGRRWQRPPPGIQGEDSMKGEAGP